MNSLSKLATSVFGGIAGGTVLSIGLAVVQDGNITYGYLVEGFLVGLFLGLQSKPRTFRRDIWLSVAAIAVMTLVLLIFNANAFVINLPSLLFMIQYVAIAAFFMGGASYLLAEKLKD